MDYRDILSDQFNVRRKVNARYSLRAFARDMSISPSRLSEVISGKGDLSRESGELICKKLNFSPLLSADFLDLIDAQVSPIESARKAARERVELRRNRVDKQYFDEDQFSLIADPKYVLIWTFMGLPAFDGCATTIARSLKLDLLEVFSALKRLEALKLVQLQNGAWTHVKTQFTAGDQGPSDDIRKFHERMSQMGRASIQNQPMDIRHLDSIVIPFESTRLGEVKQRIANFAQSLIDDFGHGGDSVYGMSLQFFKMADTIPQLSPKNDQLH